MNILQLCDIEECMNILQFGGFLIRNIVASAFSEFFVMWDIFVDCTQILQEFNISSKNTKF